MKKYLFIFTCMAIGSVFFIGCDNTWNNVSRTVKSSIPTKNTTKEIVLSKAGEATDWKPTSYKAVNNFNGIDMGEKKETVSANGLTVVFKNNSDKICLYGNKFVLEKKINGQWYEVPVAIKSNYGFNDVGYQVTSGQEKEWKVDWEWLYGRLNIGEYRIVKDVFDFRKSGDYDTYFLTSQFTIDN